MVHSVSEGEAARAEGNRDPGRPRPHRRNHPRLSDRRDALMDLTATWAAIIAFAVAAYVVMDGFDLGIGILFPGFRVGGERDMAMNSIAPVWDGNETWLVLGGGGLRSEEQTSELQSLMRISYAVFC